MKQLLTLFSITGSPRRGVASSLKSLPRWPGRKGAAASVDMCAACRTGRSKARHAPISSATRASSAWLLRRPQLGSSKPCWTSTIRRAASAARTVRWAKVWLMLPRLSDARPRTKTPIPPIGGGDGMKEPLKTELELRHLRVFLAVVESGGHTRAARTLGVSQSTVSETLIALERTLGTELFRKGAKGKGVALTRSGDALLPYARRVLALTGELVSQLAGVTTEVKATLAVAAVESISTYVLPSRLAA